MSAAKNPTRPPPCNIRPAVPADAEIIALFNRAMALESEGRTLDPPTIAAGVRAVLSDPVRGLYFVAEIDGQTVGQTMITYEWSDWHDAWFWWLQSVYVQPEFRRRGVFSALYQYITAAARARNDVSGVRLCVVRDNEPAIRTYESMGLARTRYLMHEQDWSAPTGQ